jgi:uncharacterized membrane protein
MHKIGLTLTAVGLSAIFGLASSGHALAAPLPATGDSVSVCETGYFYSTAQTAAYIAAKSGDRIYGDAGVTLTIAKGTTHTFSGSLTGTTTAEAGVIFAKASLAVGLTVGYSRAATTTQGGSWTVPSNQNPGWLEMGDHAYNVKYTKYHYASPCTKVNDKTNTIKGATNSAWIKHS